MRPTAKKWKRSVQAANNAKLQFNVPLAKFALQGVLKFWSFLFISYVLYDIELQERLNLRSLPRPTFLTQQSAATRRVIGSVLLRFDWLGHDDASWYE